MAGLLVHIFNETLTDFSTDNLFSNDTLLSDLFEFTSEVKSKHSSYIGTNFQGIFMNRYFKRYFQVILFLII